RLFFHRAGGRRAASFVFEYIPHCANRVQKSRAAIGFELFPQMADRHIYDVRQRIEVLVPYMLGQLRAADDSLRVSEKVFEQAILFRGQINALMVAGDYA